MLMRDIGEDSCYSVMIGMVFFSDWVTLAVIQPFFIFWYPDDVAVLGLVFSGDFVLAFQYVGFLYLSVSVFAHC